MDPADILERAAEIYESGLKTWAPNGTGEDNTACVLQCLMRASVQLQGQGVNRAPYAQARDALREHLTPSGRKAVAIINWNDGNDGIPKSQEIVVEALKATAKDLRNK